MGSRPGDIDRDEPKKKEDDHDAAAVVTPRAPSIKPAPALPPRPASMKPFVAATRPTVRPLHTLASSASLSSSSPSPSPSPSSPPPKNTLTFPPKTDQLPADLAELISNAETLRPPAPAPTVPPPSQPKPPRLPSSPGLPGLPSAIPVGSEQQQHVVRWTTPNRRPLAPRAVERAARSSERFLSRYDDPHPSTNELINIEELSQRDLISERPPTEDAIPSDRSTVPTKGGHRRGISAPPSSKGILELAENDLESDPIPLALQPSAASRREEAPLPNRLFRTPIPPPPTPSPSPIADTRVTEPRELGALAKAIEEQKSDPAAPAAPVKKRPTRQEAEAQLRAFLRASPPSHPQTLRLDPTLAPLDDEPPHHDDDTDQHHAIDDQEPHLLLLLRSNPPSSARVLPPEQASAEQAASTVPPTPTPALSVSPNNSSAPPPPTAISTAPNKKSTPPLANLLRRRRTLIPLIASHVVLAAAVALIVSGRRHAARAETPREPRIAIQEWSPLAGGGAPPAPSPPSGGCATSGNSRMLASSAQIGPGLDVTVLDTGFAVGLAAKQTEAVGLRVEGSGLRVAETVRVKSALTVTHVVVDREHEDEGEGLDVRIDEGEARTVMGGNGGGGAANPSFKIVARGGAIMALTDNSNKTKILWPVPGGGIRIGSAPAALPATPAGKTNPYAPPGFSKLPSSPRPSSPVVPIFAPEVMRAAGRDDGGAVVALRRPAMLWLGVTDSSLTPAGPLVSVLRKPGTVVGAPAVAQWGGGGVVAWAEKPYGEREWVIVVAGFSPDGEGATHLGHVRVIGKGMSPTIAALPDGDLLLGYADGPSGAHRVVARRLAGAELEPRGEAVVVSPESVNAGQPVAAVRADGRALIAYFAADSVLAAKSAGRAAAVHATPLACDPGL